MLQRFKKHLQKKFSFLKEKSILIAISGGIDSCVLAHLSKEAGLNFALAHCNFKLRGTESDQDEIFVKKLAEQLNTSVHTIQFDTKKYASEKGISIQMAARDLRYEWFHQLKKEHNLDCIFTAHHKDDVLETVLINFTRGTGLDGLTGIPEINGDIVRPLLKFSREEIESYAKENGIEWREDESNSSTKYFRNKIRHEVVPVLKELNPNFLTTFGKTLENLNESQLLINDRVESLKRHVMTQEKNGVISISIKKILEINNPKANLYELLKPYGFASLKDVVSLLKAQPGKQLFSKTHRLLKNRDELLLTFLGGNPKSSCLIKEDTEKIEKPIALNFETLSNIGLFSDTVAYIDKSLLKFPLTVRKWQKGDYFYPVGMNGKKKLSKYFKDEKLSLIDKENVYLLCNENEIVWIVGKRLDNRYKITDTTTSILKVEIIDTSTSSVSDKK